MTNPYDQSPTDDNGYGQQQPYNYGYNPQQSWSPPPVPDYSAGYDYSYPAGFSAQQKPDNMLLWTILSTLLCCWPIGAFGIYYSTQVDKLWEQGRFQEAENAAHTAKIFAIVASVIIVVPALIYFAIVIIAAIAGSL